MLEHFHGKENKMKNRKKIFIIITMLSTFCFSYADAVKTKTRIYPKNSYTLLFAIPICKA